jgi:glucose/arabinose dehydrogenase
MNTRPSGSVRCRLFRRRRGPVLNLLLAFALVAGGCINQPKLLPMKMQRPIDRSVIEKYPSGFVLTPLAQGLNCPTAECFDAEGSLLVAESGIEGCEPHIFGYHKDGSYFNVYPFNRTVSFFPTGFVIYGPVGGMVAWKGRVYVTHRDRNGFGVITAFGYDGSHTTVVGGLPARGDYGVNDIAIGPNDRLFFTVGMATNSGIVGLDNAWLKRYPGVHDEVYSPNGTPIATTGAKFNSINPLQGFLHPETAVTGYGQPFGQSIQSHLRSSDKPNGAVYSCRLDGAELEVRAFGLHNPRGVAVDENGHPFVSNDGMQVRGSRPVLNDPDVVVSVGRGNFFGAPDFSTTGHPITDPEYRPPLSFLAPHGYDELSQLIDREASGLRLPDDFSVLVAGVFPSQSGAAKMAFVPPDGPFKDLSGSIVVALDGDRAPFATGGLKLLGAVGGKVAIIDRGAKQVRDFLRNTAGVPASQQPYGTVALERPCDVKFGPDGSLYILDFGRMDNNGPVPRYYPGTGAIFKLSALPAAK